MFGGNRLCSTTAGRGMPSPDVFVFCHMGYYIAAIEAVHSHSVSKSHCYVKEISYQDFLKLVCLLYYLYIVKQSAYSMCTHYTVYMVE